MSQLSDRRSFLVTSALTIAGTASASFNPVHFPKGKAEHCVFIWLGGGLAQTDSFDPKRLGDPKKKIAGSYYKAIDTSVKGVQVCEHLSKIAPLMDRMTIIRTINHDVIDEHAAAVNRMHTGRNVTGTVVYPSIGSVVAHEKGAVQDGAPSYVLIGYPNVTRGPGFLGSKFNYLYLTDTVSGPAGLSRPEMITVPRQDRREALLSELRKINKGASKDKALQDYETALEQSLKLSGPAFSKVFNLGEEKSSLRESYGGEFGQRCLLARRLIERGVRFIEVSHNLNFSNGTGWDVHNQGIEKQHILIQELDQALAALTLDLESKKMLDKTLIVVATEFGRPPEFDGGGGRGHQSKTFSVLLAGAGLKHQGAFGETDELAKKPVKDLVSVPDFFATIHASLGIDPAKNLYDGDRPVPITDSGVPVKVLF
ncbi:MAG: hypothetical protein RLZ61_330 [Planctomycetota bacterium]